MPPGGNHATVGIHRGDASNGETVTPVSVGHDEAVSDDAGGRSHVGCLLKHGIIHGLEQLIGGEDTDGHSHPRPVARGQLPYHVCHSTSSPGQRHAPHYLRSRLVRARARSSLPRQRHAATKRNGSAPAKPVYFSGHPGAGSVEIEQRTRQAHEILITCARSLCASRGIRILGTAVAHAVAQMIDITFDARAYGRAPEER